LIEAAAAGVAEDDDIPPELEKTLASLPVLDDEALIQAARSHLPLEMWQEIEELHSKQQREGEEIIGLTPIGRATIATLKLNRPLLIRARRVWIRAGEHPPKD